MKPFLKKQEGQSVLIVAFALIALVALMALVVDAGNAYVQQRKIQNAMESGAQAGSLAFASKLQAGQIYGSVKNAVTANNVPISQVQAYYVLQDTQHNTYIVANCGGCTIDAYTGPNNPAPKTMPWGGQDLNVVGVQVQGNNSFSTYFAGVIGQKTMQVGGGASAICASGAESGENLFPYAVSSTDFLVGGQSIVYTEQISPTFTYHLTEKYSGGGDIGAVRWSTQQGTDNGTLAGNINNTNSGASGPWAVGNTLLGSGGSMGDSGVQNAIQSYVNAGGSHYGQKVTMPVFDTITPTTGLGTSGATYRIAGFVRFRLTGFNSGCPTGSRCISAKAQDWIDPQAEGGGPQYGIVSCKLRPQLPVPSRTLEGDVLVNTAIPNPPQPPSAVDVVNVIDISLSMGWDFNEGNPGPGDPSKISAAQSALTNFNTFVRPAQGDRVALVAFPTQQSVHSYTTCQGTSYNSYEFGNPMINFTSNITSVNSKINSLGPIGSTPTADALDKARIYLSGRNSTNRPVVILATDGLANVTWRNPVDGVWSGSPTGALPCSQLAQDDVRDRANQLKTPGSNGKPFATVYVIAIGNDFNSALVKYIATSPAYVSQATDLASMKQIYQNIANQTQGGGDCPPSYAQEPEGNVHLVIQNVTTGDTYNNVYTDSGGHYSIPNVNAGTFQIQSASWTDKYGYAYTVFTDGVGGGVISNPSTDVGLGSGTYSLNAALATNAQIGCAAQ